MKYGWLICFICLLLTFTGCKEDTLEPQQTAPPQIADEQSSVLPELIGSWVSASGGELEMIETITFFPDGTMTVSCTYQGADAGTIYGTYYGDAQQVVCDITQGADPYTIRYMYLIDGRELTLENSDRTAHYLRNA